MKSKWQLERASSSEIASPLSQDEPLVTIGMPTFNREWSLPRVLESMLNLDYDKRRIRICFVDNESTDATMKIIEEFRAEHGPEYESVVVVVARSMCLRTRSIFFSPRVSGVWMPITTTPLSERSLCQPVYHG